MAKQTICLVGRPNTGKSTLFNRIVGKKVAIIEDAPGVTRDRIYSQASFNDIPFYLIDTGGIDLSEGDFNQEIRVQVEVGIEESDTIVFVVPATLLTITLSSFNKALTRLLLPTLGLPITAILIFSSTSSYPGSYPSVTSFKSSFTPHPCSADIATYSSKPKE